MFQSFEEFTVADSPCIEQCDAFISKHGLHVAVVIDHLCFKCGSASEYGQMRAMLEFPPPPPPNFFRGMLAMRSGKGEENKRVRLAQNGGFYLVPTVHP